jgi:hypothetical protein
MMMHAQVKFDMGQTQLYGSAAPSTPPLLFCTSDGALVSTCSSPSDAGLLQTRVLLREPCSLNSFDVTDAGGGSGGGEDIAAVTDHECMVLLHRAAQDE